MKPIAEILDTAEKYACDPAIVAGVLARVPPSWALIERSDDGAAFRRGNIQAIVSVGYQTDHRIWVHVSACGRTGTASFFLPSWEDMKRVKHDLIGPDRWAYQVFPSEADYINHNANVLHLFALLEGEPALPDFTKGMGTL